MPGGALDRDILLPDELWAEVFCHLRPEVYVDLTKVDILEAQPVAEEHRQFHRLRLVCKRFSQIFHQHQKLVECLYLKGDLQHTGLSSLLPWSLGHKSSIRTFIAYCGSSCTEVALALLSGAALDAVVIRKASPCTISTLAAFASVTTVDLKFSGFYLDLTALHMLQNLRELHLHGGVFDVDRLAAHVTYLFLPFAHVTSAQSCSFVTGLQQLDMYASSFTGLHPLGLSACTALTRLQLCDAEIRAEVQTEYTNVRQGKVTTLALGLPVLTNLTHLDMRLHSYHHGLFEIDKLLRLKALKHLQLHFMTGMVQIELCAAFTCLLELEKLVIWLDGDLPSTLTLNVPWHKMFAIESVMFLADMFKFGTDILGFTQIKGLKWLSLHDGHVMNGPTAKSVEALRYNMEVTRPDVVFESTLQVDPDQLL